MYTAKRKLPSARSHLAIDANAARTPLQGPEEREKIDRKLSLPEAELRFIRLSEVLAICGKSRTSVYELIKKGSFPAPIKLGGRSSAWVKSEVLQWAKNCVDISRMK
jgi:prophage regulatory protein